MQLHDAADAVAADADENNDDACDERGNIAEHLKKARDRIKSFGLELCYDGWNCRMEERQYIAI